MKDGDVVFSCEENHARRRFTNNMDRKENLKRVKLTVESQYDAGGYVRH